MREPAHHRLRTWDLEELLARHTGLRIEPSPSDDIVVSGRLAFRVEGPAGAIIDDEYSIECHVPARFPAALPRVYETGLRIPADYHKLTGNALCLGAPTAIRVCLAAVPSLVTFVDEFLVPYLAGYTHFARTGTMLYGELAHGPEGIRQFLRELFRCCGANRPEEFVRLASLKKRTANKFPCPCGSGRRVGKCHNRTVNAHRRALGRAWFAAEYERLLQQLPTPQRRAGR